VVYPVKRKMGERVHGTESKEMNLQQRHGMAGGHRIRPKTGKKSNLNSDAGSKSRHR